VAWLRDREWALSADDVLWRRSKLGLRLSEQERGRLLDWFDRANDDGKSASTGATRIA
jgi:glycerol-3-phosphate dehydrogenase